MKRLIFAIIFQLLTVVVNAQIKNTIIDSLIKGDYHRISNYFRTHNLTRQEEKNIIKQVSVYKKSTSKVDRYYAYHICNEMSIYSKHLKTQQEAVYQVIDLYWIGGDRNDRDNYKKKHFTSKTVKRLIQVIQGLNEDEIKINLDDFLYARMNNKYVIQEIQMLHKQTGKDIKTIRDSIYGLNKRELKDYRVDLEKEVSKGQYIKFIGWLNCKEYIPLFEKLLLDKRFRSPEHQDALKYALARMGIKKYLNEFLKRKDFDFQYLNCQEAYWAYIENDYDYDDSYKIFADDDWPIANSAERTLNEMTKCFLNLPKELQLPSSEVGSYADNPLKNREKTKQAYEWFKANRGHYKFKDTEYCF